MKKKIQLLPIVLASVMCRAYAAYVTEGLVLHYDAIDNVGTGVHDPAATSWRELTGKGGEFALPAGAVWTDDAISFPYVSQTLSVLGEDFTDASQQDFTFEFVVRLDPLENLDDDRLADVIDMRRATLWFRRPGAKSSGYNGFGAVGSRKHTGGEQMYWLEFSNYHGELHTVDFLKRFHTYAVQAHAGGEYSNSSFRWAVDGGVYYASGEKHSEAGFSPLNDRLTLGSTRRSCQIRAIRVYNRALSEQEIAQNAAEDAARWPESADPESPSDPFADARWYFRGAKGESGIYGGSTNIVSALQAGGSKVGIPDGATPADRTLSNYGAESNCVINTMDVVSPFTGRTLKDCKVIDFRQCVRTDESGNKLCRPCAKRIAISGCYTNMHETTVLARFRIDDYAADEHSDKLSILDLGYAWSGQAGTSLRLFESDGVGSDDFWVRAYHGSDADDFKGMLGKDRYRISKGKWIDFAITVKGRVNCLSYQVEGGDFYTETRDTDIAKNKDTRYPYMNLGTDLIGVGDGSIKEMAASAVTQFRGQIQQLAIWDRALSQDEVKQCFRADCGDKDDALKLGVVNHNSAEFAGDATTVDAGANDAWLSMTNALARAGDKLTVRFDLPSDKIFLPRTFRFSASPSAPVGAKIAVKINGCPIDDALAVVADKTVSVAVPPVVFKSTGNTLVIKRTDDVAGIVGIDAVTVTAGGSDTGSAPTGVANRYDVYSDAYCWYTGFSDENGDGFFFPDNKVDTEQPCDCWDALRIADRDSVFHTWRHSAAVSGSVFRHERANVALPAAGKVFADEPCLRIVAENRGTEENPSGHWGGLSRPIFAVSNQVGYSAVARIRLDNYMHPSQERAQVMGTGYDWSNSRGCCLSLTGDPANMAIYVSIGRSNYMLNGTQEGDERNRLAQGKWIDLGYVVSNGYVHVFSCVEGGEIVEQVQNGGTGALGTPAASSYCHLGSTSGGGAAGSGKIEDLNGFNGLFHHFALWNRPLSAEEMALAMKWPKPDVFHIGTVNGSAQEFLGAEQPFEVPANGAFRTASVTIVPGGVYEIRFPYDAEQKMNQRLVVATTGDSCDASFRIELNGERVVNYAQEDRSEIKFLTVAGGGWSEFGIRGSLLQSENVLRLTRVDDNAGPVFLDAISLGNLGKHVRVVRCGGLKVVIR